MNVSQNIILKFQKTETRFVDERELIATTRIFSGHWKTLVPFACERKDLKTHL